MVKYKIDKFAYGLNPPIVRVEIVRETAQFVVLPPRTNWSNREYREAKDGNYFDTFDEAKAELVRRRQQKHDYALQSLEDARKALCAALACEMPNPSTATAGEREDAA